MPDTTAPPKPETLTPPAAEPDLAAVTEELRERLAPRIQLLEKLGEGGMGVVFLGRDPMLHRSVAIKVLAPALASDAKARERFTREAQSAAAIPHPNVVSIYEVGDLPRTGLSYFVMQLVEGDSLATLHGGQTLPAPAIRRIVGEVAAALAAAHARNLIHRDIKPANIMIERASGRAIVLDFGIAAVLEVHPPETGPGDTVTSTGAIGTPSHISPEQARGKRVTDKTDVYSLGVVAFELATGRTPFLGVTPLQMLHAHLKDRPPSVHELRPELDERLATLIDRCLSKDPDERPSAAELARYLRPGMETAIEWPPPGMGHVRETGRGLFASLRTLTLLVMTFFLAVYAQPRLGTVSWRQGETSPFWLTLYAPYTSVQSMLNNSRLPPGASRLPLEASRLPDSTPLWFFMVVLAGIASLAAAGVVTRRALRLAKESRAAHTVGYPWSAVAAVAADAGPDTADLVNGLGKYSALGAGERSRLLRLRRLESLAILAAVLATLVLPIAWLRVAPAAGATTEWLTGVEMILLSTPLLFLLVAFALRVPERTARRRGPRLRGKGGASGAMPAVGRALVDGWLASLKDPTVLPRSIPRWSLLQLPIVVVGGVLLIIVLATMGISAFSIWSSPMLRDGVDAWREGRRAIAAPTPPVRWATIDSQVGVILRSAASRVIPSEARDLQLILSRIAAGRLAWRSMNVTTYVDGTRMLREALSELATVARRRGDLQLAQRARDVSAAVDTYLSSNAIIGRGWAPLAMADPRDSSGVAEIRDRGNAPAVRRELLRGVVDGYCYNGRERLFGVSPLRRDLLSGAARGARDLPGIDSVITRERARLAEVLALGGVSGVRDRSRRCPGR
jgi:serine/threonine protein kinase